MNRILYGADISPTLVTYNNASTLKGSEVVSMSTIIDGHRYTYDKDSHMLVYTDDMDNQVSINPNEFKHTSPTLASDAQLIVIREEGEIVDILALQYRTFNAPNPEVEVATSFRLHGGIDGLRKLRDDIDRSIKNFENAEK